MKLETLYQSLQKHMPEENHIVQELYDTWLGGSHSDKCPAMLHTKYHAVEKMTTALNIKWWNSNSKLQPTRCNVSWLIFSYRRSTCFRLFLHPSSGAHNCTYCFRYCHQYCCLLLSCPRQQQATVFVTIPDAVCTVMCSWWWAEEPPETCRASVGINKSRNVASCWL